MQDPLSHLNQEVIQLILSNVDEKDDWRVRYALLHIEECDECKEKLRRARE